MDVPSDDAGIAALNEIRSAPLGTGVWVAIGLYLFALLLTCFVPWVRRRGWQRTEDSSDAVAQHFIANGSLGYFVLPLTLFATLFSGIALVGVPAEGATMGFTALRWVFSLVPVGFGYQLFGPRMRRMSDYRGGYMTGVDVVSDRYRDSELRLVVAAVQIFAAFLYVLAQLVAIGATLSALSNGRISRVTGAAILAVIMYIYEAVGGMQSVAWTDVIQGIVLLVGFIFVYVVQQTEFGGVPAAVAFLAEARAGLVAVPSALGKFGYLPFLFSFVPFVLYGHLQQRVFAAASERGFKMALILLTFSGIFIMTGSTMTGIVAKAYFIDTFGETAADSLHQDETFGLIMRVLMLRAGSETHPNYIMGSLILAASVAALMSTADSAMLSLSSVVCLDIFKPYVTPDASPRKLVWIGRIFSFVASVIGVAISATAPNLVQLLLTQQQFLMQLLPPFFCAMYLPNVRSRPLTIGLVVGLIINTVLVFGGLGALAAGLAGTIALIINMILVAALNTSSASFLRRGWSGPEAAWKRFGDALPEEMITFVVKLPGWASELIHPPFIQYGLGVVFVSLVYVIPWFFTTGTLNFMSGLPDWVVMQMTSFVFVAIALNLITYYGWGIASVSKAEDIELSIQSDATSIVDSDSESVDALRNRRKGASDDDDDEDEASTSSSAASGSESSDVEVEEEPSRSGVEMATTASV